MGSVTKKYRFPPAKWILILLLAVCVVRLWLVPLPSSFWVDEMVTAFVVHYGPSHPSLAVAPQVTATLYYALPRFSERLFGFSEAAYRLPSVFLMGIALFIIARIAARLVDARAAWFTVFACLALRAFDYQAADARPYALGTCVAAASVLFLVRWLDRGRWPDAVLFILMGALLWRVHLIYWPFYLVLGTYAIVRLVRGETSVPWRDAGLVFGLLGLMLIPTAINAVAIDRQASAHVIVPRPSAGELRGALKFALITQCAILAWGLAVLFRWKRETELPPLSSQILIFAWWLSQPLCLFLYSEVTGNSLFVPRYLTVALPGAALMGTFAAAYFLPSEKWHTASLVLAAGVLLLVGQWRQLWPRHDISDWRAAAQAVNQWTTSPDTPVICPSPFIEARPPNWRPDYQTPGFLYSYLPVYRLTGKPYFFPFEHSEEARKYAVELSAERLVFARRFLIYGGDRNVCYWREWFAARPEFKAWPNRLLGPFGDVGVALFENPKFASLAGSLVAPQPALEFK